MGYRTTRGGTIHGVRLSTMKKLLAKPFSTVDAAKALHMSDPDIGMMLRRMEEDEIVDYAGLFNGIEQWRSGCQGDRILGAKIAPAQPVSKAMKALDRLLDVADQIAADETSSFLPVEIYLFGSVLRGGDEEGLVGDLDVAVKSDWRLKGEDQRKLEQAEYGGYIPIWKMGWPRRRMIARLAKAVRLASIHEMHDAEAIDAQRQLVWRLDRNTGIADRTRGALVGSSTQSPGPPSSRDEDYVAPPPLRAWRTPPAAVGTLRSPVSNMYRGALLDELAHISRHLWARGETIEEVAERLYARPQDVAILLTWNAADVPLADAIAGMKELAEVSLTADLPFGELRLNVDGRNEFDLVMTSNVICYQSIPAEEFAPAMTLLHALRSHLPGQWSSRWKRADTRVSCVIPLVGDIPIPRVRDIRAIVEPIVIGRAQAEEAGDDDEPVYRALAEIEIAAGNTWMRLESRPPSHRNCHVEHIPVPEELLHIMQADSRIVSISSRSLL